ncbi:unnamed protein product [Litomosoides sigmodontis]|uniref:Zinc transporter ZIP1 n=1 Tax=Litomosoides sigmodontis TaxID=42156 RepID=A0A3P6SGG1_LITSI|nr:unnamed protein product [Litomosoides sigmodontis]
MYLFDLIIFLELGLYRQFSYHEVKGLTEGLILMINTIHWKEMHIDIRNLFLSPPPPGPIVPVHEFLRASLITALFVTTLLACSFAFLLRRIVNTTTGCLPLLSVISVFGGGVFLATCLLDLLPDAKESLRKIEKMRQINYSYPVMEIFVAIGFLLVLSIEQIVVFIREKQWHGSTDIDSLITGHHDHNETNSELVNPHSEYESELSQESCTQSQSTVRVVLLVMALSLHAVFEGLSLGLVGGTNEIMQSALSFATAVICSIIFAAQIIIGGFGGIAILDFVSRGSPLIAGTVSFITQATACGTFLYITCFEILPREFHQRQLRVVKLLSLIAGFALIASLIALFP